MYLDLVDIGAIVLMFAMLLIMSFSLYLPLKYFVKKEEAVLALVIPISLGAIILFGYIFYLSPFLKFFPIFLLVFMILFNIFFIKRVEKPKVNFKNVRLYSILVIPVLYTRFYDAIKYVGPGNNDTFSHILFLLDLDKYGFISNSYYAPGLQLLFYPIHKIISISEIYRFGGPCLGIIIFLTLFFFIRAIIKNKMVIVLFIVLACFPIYNQLTLQTISFFSTALSFIFLPPLIYLQVLTDLSIKAKFFLVLILNLSLAFTVPYFFVQLIPCELILLLVTLLFRKKIGKTFNKTVQMSLLVLILGLIFAYGHVILQTKVLGRGTSSFPTIPVVKLMDNNIVISSNMAVETHIGKIDKSNFWNSEFFKSYIGPVYKTGLELIMIKDIRCPNSIIAFGSYVWLILLFFLLYFSLHKKNITLLTVVIFSLVFGIATQTGILEMSTYRGRSGWYFLLLSLIVIVLVCDLIPQKIKNINLNYFLLPLFLVCFIDPPIFYRSYYSDIFNNAYTILRRSQKSAHITFITDQESLILLSPNLNVLPFKAESLDNNSGDITFLVVEKNFLLLDPILSQKAFSNDRGYKEYFSEQNKIKKAFVAERNKVLASKYFNEYKKFAETANVVILERKSLKPLKEKNNEH